MAQPIDQIKEDLTQVSRTEMPSNLRERLRIAEAQGGRAIWQIGIDGRVRLFDRIDLQWTVPMQPSQAQYAARKVVFACTGAECTEATPLEGQIAKHIQRVRRSYESHRSAELTATTEDEASGHRCTGCGVFFLTRKSQGRAHLERIKAQYPNHHQAGEVTMLRFSLGLDVPAPVSNETNGAGPVVNQAERSRSPRSRRRGRRRRR